MRYWIVLAAYLLMGAALALAVYAFSVPDVAEAEIVIDAPIKAVRRST